MNTAQISKVCRKKIGDVDKKIPDVSGVVATTVLHKKLEKLRTKYPILVV